MSETISPFQAANRDILIHAATALSSPQRFNAEERKMRYNIVVSGAMSFLPADPRQTMLAVQAVAHHLAFIDGMAEACAAVPGRPEIVKVTRMTLAQTQAVLRLNKEIAALRKAFIDQLAVEHRASARAAAAPGNAADGQARAAGTEAMKSATAPAGAGV